MHWRLPAEWRNRLFPIEASSLCSTLNMRGDSGASGGASSSQFALYQRRTMAGLRLQACRSTARAIAGAIPAMRGAPESLSVEAGWPPSLLHLPSRLGQLCLGRPCRPALPGRAGIAPPGPSTILLSRSACACPPIPSSSSPRCTFLSSSAPAFLPFKRSPVAVEIRSSQRGRVPCASGLLGCMARQPGGQLVFCGQDHPSCPSLASALQPSPAYATQRPPPAIFADSFRPSSSQFAPSAPCFPTSFRCNRASPLMGFVSEACLEKCHYSSVPGFRRDQCRLQRGPVSALFFVPSRFPAVQPRCPSGGVSKTSGCSASTVGCLRGQACRPSPASRVPLSPSRRSVSPLPTSGCRKFVLRRCRHRPEHSGEWRGTASSSFFPVRASSVVFLVLGSLLLADLIASHVYGQRRLLAAFLVANGAVFAAWQFAAARGGRLHALLCRNFVLSLDALQHGRVYTFLTACLSHRNATHLVLNLFFIHQLFSLLSPDLSDSDFLSLFGLAALLGGLGHFLASRSPVLGASAFAYSLLWIEATRNSRELFRILPIPFLPVTALQFAQLGLLTELTMAFLSRPSIVARFPSSRFLQFAQGVSWMGHVGGLTAGCLYSWYQRRVAGDGSWKSFLELSKRYGVSDWTFTVQGKQPHKARVAQLCTCADLRSTLNIILLECKVLAASSDLEKAVIVRELDKLRSQKELRRQIVARGGIFR